MLYNFIQQLILMNTLHTLFQCLKGESVIRGYHSSGKTKQRLISKWNFLVVTPFERATSK